MPYNHLVDGYNGPSNAETGYVYDSMGVNLSSFSAVFNFLDDFSRRVKVPKILDGRKARNIIHPLNKFGVLLSHNIIQVLSLGGLNQIYRLHPRIEMFYDFVKSNDLYDEVLNSMLTGDQEVIKPLLTALHKKLKSNAQLNSERNFLKGPEKNNKFLRTYVNSLFVNYARLLVVRVDLSYKRDFKDLMSPNQIMEHRKALISKSKNNPLTENWLGYAWRLEYGPQSGFHYHLVVFLDGSKFKNDAIAAENIGMRWNEITDGKGRYFNCGLDKTKYRYVGIGLVDYHDQDKRKHMMKALSYLTKSEKLIKLKLSNSRTFGRGQILKGKSGLGRPRSKVNMST